MGVTKPISSVPLFSYFSASLKYTLAIKYHVYIWQVLPQLSCGDTCKIWMWCKESNKCIYKIENVAYGKSTNGSLVTTTPVWRNISPLNLDHLQVIYIHIYTYICIYKLTPCIAYLAIKVEIRFCWSGGGGGGGVKYKRDIQWLTCILAMLKNK